MQRKNPPNPTGRELDIMRVLWRLEPCTVRDVLEYLNRDREEPFAYTTILRFFQIMTEKGLVTRKSEGRSHLYRSAIPAQQTKKRLVRDLMDRAFSGSPKDLVLHLLGEESTQSKDLSDIRAALQELEQEDKS